MSNRFCNVCGKKFDMWDEQEDFSICRHVGYGSKFDGSIVRLDLCCGCFDRLLDGVLAGCAFSPVEEP